MLRMNEKRFVEVVDATNGKDAAVVEALVRNGMDVKYKRFSTGYTYYRLRATRKEVKAFANQLETFGYNYHLTMNDRYFHVYKRAH